MEKMRSVWPFEMDEGRVPVVARDGMTGEAFRSLDQLVLAGQLQDMRGDSDALVDPRFLSSDDAMAMGATGEHVAVQATEVLIVERDGIASVDVRPAVAYAGMSERGHMPMDAGVRKEALGKLGLVPKGDYWIDAEIAPCVDYLTQFKGWSGGERTLICAHAKWLVCGELGVVYKGHPLGRSELESAVVGLGEPRVVAKVAEAAQKMAEHVVGPAKKVLREYNDERLACPFPDLMRRNKNRWCVRNVWREAAALGRRFMGQASLRGMMAGAGVAERPGLVESGLKPYVRSKIGVDSEVRGMPGPKCPGREQQRTGVRVDMKGLLEALERNADEGSGNEGSPSSVPVFFAQGCSERVVESEDVRLVVTSDAKGVPMHMVAEVDGKVDGVTLEFMDERGKIVAIPGGDQWRMVVKGVLVIDDPRVLSRLMRERVDEGLDVGLAGLER